MKKDEKRGRSVFVSRYRSTNRAERAAGFGEMSKLMYKRRLCMMFPLLATTGSATSEPDHAGLRNVVSFCESLINGSAPEGDRAFDSLKAMIYECVGTAMKFFTMKWWASQSHGAGAQEIAKAFSDYADHLTVIKPSLTPTLLAICDQSALHDASLQKVVGDVTSKTLRMELDVDDDRDKVQSVALIYRGLAHLDAKVVTNDPLQGERGFGSLGYHEIDLRETGGFIHRMLFSSGLEIHIHFEGLELSRGFVEYLNRMGSRD